MNVTSNLGPISAIGIAPKDGDEVAWLRRRGRLERAFEELGGGAVRAFDFLDIERDASIYPLAKKVDELKR